MRRLLIHVQYLKGIGHLQRMGLIAEAAAAEGLEVHIASGGLPLPFFAPKGAGLHQLPPLQAGPGGFSDLRDEAGAPINEEWLADRRDRLLGLFAELRPDALLIETFPFGRRQLTGELTALIEAARASRPRTRIACSIRDVLQQETRKDRLDQTVARLRAGFDMVLVHGDPRFIGLEQSFARYADIADLVRHTGLVAAPESVYRPAPDTPQQEVIVSAGGGAVGPTLFDAALAARPLTSLSRAPWRLLTGPHLAEADYARLTRRAPEGVTVERFRTDFRALLAAARLSISYAGYNTSLDLLRARVPGVLLTYSGGGGESEQAQRAARLAELDLAETLEDRNMTPEGLARIIDRAAANRRCADVRVDLDGAAKSARLLRELAEAKGR
ncbi:MAG: glycosyltransferase [Pseudomonadota bacterium]|nr:glycosyltransferase [Pseudomonadota bacterium]